MCCELPKKKVKKEWACYSGNQRLKKITNHNLLDTIKLVIKIKCDWIQIP